VRESSNQVTMRGLSLLKNPSGHGIGLPMKAMVDDFGYSNRALLSRDPVSLHGF
jgi:hypothetical protein